MIILILHTILDDNPRPFSCCGQSFMSMKVKEEQKTILSPGLSSALNSMEHVGVETSSDFFVE